MKKIAQYLLLLLVSFSFSISGSSQHVFVNDVDINELDIEYCELRVGQPLNPTKVKIYVDYGQAFSLKRQNIMTPEKKVIKFNSAVHALNFMDQNGWDYIEQVAVQTDQSTSFKYVMKKTSN